MIEVCHLYKSFENKDVLIDINTTFEDGKTNLIIGQSGSGKTVLMKNLVGLLRPTSGQVLYDGRDFVQMSKHEQVMMRREMGMIFQSAALFDSMTVLENVMFPLDMFSSMNLRERTRRAQECLDRVNLKGAEEKFPGEISGGMQKRVAIARAIALNPKYLFCDEPNSGLDPKTSLVIDELLQSITKEFNITTIINTHDMNSVMGIGENIIFIYEGHKDWQGESSQIMESDNQRLTDFIFASDLLKNMRKIVIDILIVVSIIDEIIADLNLRTETEIRCHIIPELRFCQDDEHAMAHVTCTPVLTTPEIDEAREGTFLISEIQAPDTRQLETMVG